SPGPGPTVPRRASSPSHSATSMSPSARHGGAPAALPSWVRVIRNTNRNGQVGMGETVGGTVEQVRALVGWVGVGRKLTQTGRVTLADARALVEVLDTGDRMDPVIGDRTFKTK